VFPGSGQGGLVTPPSPHSLSAHSNRQTKAEEERRLGTEAGNAVASFRWADTRLIPLQTL